MKLYDPESDRFSYGIHAGKAIVDVAKIDPDYLVFLAETGNIYAEEFIEENPELFEHLIE